MFCKKREDLSSGIVPNPESSPRSKRYKKRENGMKTLMIISFVLIIGITLPFFSSCISTPSVGADFSVFDIDFTNTGIKEFLDAVCENIDGDIEYVEVGHISTSNSTGYALVTIKLCNYYEPINTEVSFWGNQRKNIMSAIAVKYRGWHDSQQVACNDLIVKAIEKLMSGKSLANTYTNQFNSIGRQYSGLMYEDEKILADYSLSENAGMRIYLDSFGSDWTGFCRIYNKQEDGNGL